MQLRLSPGSVADYKTFLQIKSLPKYRFQGRTAIFPDEYASRLGIAAHGGQSVAYEPHPAMFDYQRDITAIAAEKGKYCLFEDCGLGKTLQELDYVRHVARCLTGDQCVLIVAPLMVVRQTMQEAQRFYGGDLGLVQVKAADLQDWLIHGQDRIGITNYDALTDQLRPGRLAGLVLDESSMLKSHYGAWGQICLDLGRGLRWKLAATGTPAPNDRIEYANHAVFMDAYPTINAFLARFFVNKGQTQERWMLKPHALEPFYRALSHWSIFLTNPATYGWKDNTASIPPIYAHIHDVPMTTEQRELVQAITGQLMASAAGGITKRASMGQIAKGSYRGRAVATNKPAFIRRLVDSWPDESTLVWCGYNAEQDGMAATFPEAANITGDTPYETRLELVDAFKAGQVKQLISKPKILGFGLNLQVATRQVFSWLQDSYESYYQAVKRSNRYGSTRPLNAHIPITEIERPMAQNVLDKAKRVQADTDEQERIFKHARIA
jgi:hypothetical protein